MSRRRFFEKIFRSSIILLQNFLNYIIRRIVTQIIYDLRLYLIIRNVDFNFMPNINLRVIAITRMPFWQFLF